MLNNSTNQTMGGKVKKRKSRRTIEEWRTLIKSYEESGVEKSIFCKEHDISMASLIQWRKKLTLLPATTVSESMNRFVKLCPTEEKASSSGECGIELILPHGMILKITA